MTTYYTGSLANKMQTFVQTMGHRADHFAELVLTSGSTPNTWALLAALDDSDKVLTNTGHR